MKIDIHNKCSDFNSYRAARVKSLFNAENGCDFKINVELDIDDDSWQIGLIVGPSGSGKTSIGTKIFEGNKIYDFNTGWSKSKPIIDDISPSGDFNEVTGALAAVGLGDVPSWLRPFNVLSNGQKFRAGLAKLICEKPDSVVVDEFTSVVDRQIAKMGAQAFQKSWRRSCKGKKIVLLSCHYDIIDWLQPDWVFDTGTNKFERGLLRQRPKINLQIWKVDSSYWRYFKQHYYLDLHMPPAAEFYIGTVESELVCHLAVAPFFTANCYRATRLVVMPEWQGVGVGTKFLEWVCEFYKQGKGRCKRKYPTMFHTSHPQLCNFLRNSKNWIQKSLQLYGGNKTKSAHSIKKARIKTGRKFSGGERDMGCTTGYGGHFRAVQGFKYIGKK